jgi:hypothetical protein
MNKIKNKLFFGLGLLATLASVIGISLAAFTDEGKILGSTFTIGSADLKFLLDLPRGTDPANLVDQLNGPSFSNIGPNWEGVYVAKLTNAGTKKINITSYADYTTANDPDDLRNNIEVAIYEWNDPNQNGLLDEGEQNVLLGKKTITKWKTEGIYLGERYPGATMPLVFRFSTTNLSATKQGKSAIFDFNFEATENN